MKEKLIHTIWSIIVLLVLFTVFFQSHPERFLRREEEPVSLSETENADINISFTGKRAGEDIPHLMGTEEFAAQYPFNYFTVEPVEIIPTGVYELARWRQSTGVVNRRTWNYPQVTTSVLWAMTGYNQYFICEFPDGSHALALYDKGMVMDGAEKGSYILPISVRAGVNSSARPYLMSICEEYGVDNMNVIYAFDDVWYREHSGQILLLRLGIIGGFVVAVSLLWAFLVDGRKRKKG